MAMSFAEQMAAGKVFSIKTKTESQQKITNYIARFNAEVRNSDESQKTLKDSLTHWL